MACGGIDIPNKGSEEDIESLPRDIIGNAASRGINIMLSEKTVVHDSFNRGLSNGKSEEVAELGGVGIFDTVPLGAEAGSNGGRTKG